MPFSLTIGTERATALQQSIQDELTRRGYSQDADPVMAEYITIMVINNKTAVQITSELEDLIGTEFDSSFTDWLFVEAAKGAPGTEEPAQVVPASAEPILEASLPRDAHPHVVDSSRRTNGPRIYQQAVSQAIPSASTGQKRRADGRSPSPNTPNKSRRTDLPTAPRAMQREPGGPQANSRSLLDRVGGPTGSRTAGSPGRNFKHDEIQARIDNIVNNAPDNSMVMGGFPGMNGMDMNPMANMGNPIILQEIMMNQMALMAQMASSMGMLNPTTGQFVGPGFPMQGVMPQDAGMFPGMNNGMQGPMAVANGRGRGGSRPTRGSGRGRGGSVSAPSAATLKLADAPASEAAVPPKQPVIAAPTPALAIPSTHPVASQNATATPQHKIPYALPERPQSPTLCKFGLKCTNPHCRYSHPSPVATPESGVVLSNEACEKGKDCKDQDCIKAHVSPAVLNPSVEKPAPSPVHQAPHVPPSPVPCRFGAACTRPNCAFAHPRNVHNNTPCKFGAACTRTSCPYQHPEGRTLPSTFHRGLSVNSPVVTIATPEAGSMGGVPSPHKSVTFNNPGPGAGVKEKLERQMREIQEKKSEAERAVREAEAAAAAAAKKKDDSKPVPITV